MVDKGKKRTNWEEGWKKEVEDGKERGSEKERNRKIINRVSRKKDI